MTLNSENVSDGSETISIEFGIQKNIHFDTLSSMIIQV